MQDADDEDLPPLEEDVDEGSRMEVTCSAPCSVYCAKRCSHSEWLITGKGWASCHKPASLRVMPGLCRRWTRRYPQVCTR